MLAIISIFSQSLCNSSSIIASNSLPSVSRTYVMRGSSVIVQKPRMFVYFDALFMLSS